MECRYCKDEICVNADCPCVADYCPVPDMEGVCRFEDRSVIYAHNCGYKADFEGKS